MTVARRHRVPKCFRAVEPPLPQTFTVASGVSNAYAVVSYAPHTDVFAGGYFSSDTRCSA